MQCRSWTCNFPVVSFSSFHFPRSFFYYEDLFSGDTWEYFLFISFFCFFFLASMGQARIYSLCFYLFLQKIRRPVLFPTSWLLLIVIDRFANRNSCGYCFRRFGKFPRERLQWSLSKVVVCQQLRFIYCSWLKFSPDFQNTEELSRGVPQK